MAINFEATMTEADFTQPLLEPTEERYVRELHPEPDLAVEGLAHSVLSRVASLLGVR
jgi:hypothetical protein